MAGMQITYTPTPGGSARSVSLDAIGAGVASIRGNDMPLLVGETSVTVGGTPVTIVHDAYWEITIEARGLRFPPTEVPTDPIEKFWKNLYSWISHAKRGETFAVEFDSSKTFNTTCTGALAAGDVTIPVANDTGMTAGDWFYIEDASDVTVHDKMRIDSVTTNGGAGTITLESGSGMGLNHAFLTASKIRYHEYWPSCVLLGPAQILTEREAGKGANIWDLEFRFRTVR